MRRGDDVFFFTLIDFLLQVFFFGLVLYVVSQAFAPKPLDPKEDKARKDLIEKANVSNLAELTDMLSKLVPMDKLRGTAEYISRNGGWYNIKAGYEAAKAAGGPERLGQIDRDMAAKDEELTGLRNQARAWGTPSCVYETAAERTRPKLLAKLRVTDERVVLSDPTPELLAVLKQMNLEFDAVRNLSHDGFRHAFAPLNKLQPQCRYFLDVLERPKLLDSMNTVWSAFRTNR